MDEVGQASQAQTGLLVNSTSGMPCKHCDD